MAELKIQIGPTHQRDLALERSLSVSGVKNDRTGGREMMGLGLGGSKTGIYCRSKINTMNENAH